MRASLLVAILLLLAGCFGGTDMRQSPASYDFSSAQPEADSPRDSVLRQIEVQAPSWLDTTAMQYRLSYAERTRRQAYAGSRWVAPPASLLEQRLKRRLLNGTGAAQTQISGCRLRVELDELVQDFDRPERSQVIMEARVTLFAPRNNTVLARERLRVLQAAGADARSSVIGMEAATRQFGDQIENWLRQIKNDTLIRCGLS